MLVWTDYVLYRVSLRGFDFAKLEDIVKYSIERYHDNETGRAVVVGHYDNELVILPYEEDKGTITPITVHITTRQQINMRLKTGRFSNE